MVAQGKGDTFKPGYQFGGEFEVPSYRTGLFLDPKGRGTSTGYDFPVGLAAAQTGENGGDKLYKENNKVLDIGRGRIEFEVKAVNKETGEISGIYVAQQPSDTDLGSKEAKQVMTKGIWYASLDA